MRNCTTHSHACDCREEKFKKLELENQKLREGLEAIANKKTCEKLYPECEKYINYEQGWEGVAIYARTILTELKKEK